MVKNTNFRKEIELEIGNRSLISSMEEIGGSFSGDPLIPTREILVFRYPLKKSR
jgi:hypothetical protein